MAYPDSNWLKKVTAKANNIEDSDRLCSLFNNKTWKNLNKSGFDKVNHYNPKEAFLQLMSVTGNVFNNRKHKYEGINRFRKGDKTQYLTSIDVKENVRSGVYFVKILETFVCENLKFNPFERIIIDMTAKRNGFGKTR